MTEIPTKEQIRGWIAENPSQSSKRDIARAFGVKGADRVELKRRLRELEEGGHLEKRRKNYRDPEKLPPVTVLQVQPPDSDGDLFARPLEWHGEGPEPRVLVAPRRTDPALGGGDRILARLTEVAGEDHQYRARLVRKIGTNPKKLLGVFRKDAEGGRIQPVDKGATKEWEVAADATHGARDGELVEAEQAGRSPRLGLPRARVVDRLGDPSAAKAVSLIAIHQHGIPDDFPDAAIAEADRAKPAGLAGRSDLRELPLVTIDPSDARDHDDAVHAAPDTDPANPGGHIVWVAIADVAAYVRPETALDREARRRGNSTYFPDRVVPMLPDRLSGDLCSLHEGIPRPVIAVRMVLNAGGEKIGHRFERAMMASAGSLTYPEVQAAEDGAETSERAAALRDAVIAPLYAAWRAAGAARAVRQPLELDMPEREITLSEEGRVTAVTRKPRLDAHRVIEEFMILANVAAAEELTRRRTPLLFRVHEEPAPEKLDALREIAGAAGLTLAKGQVLETRHLNALLDAAAGTSDAELINLSTLRSMTQAYYSPENFGHFGLALGSYAHFTSPIRRYADLALHRALIAAHGWGGDGQTGEEADRLGETARHISETERRSMAAERDTSDRYLAQYLSGRVGAEFEGRISGVARFGVFVTLAESGADGLIPIGMLGQEYFHHDAAAQTLMGADSGREIGVGQPVTVRLSEAVPVTGGLRLELLSLDGEAVPEGGAQAARRGRKPGKGKPPQRAPARAAKKDARTKRKVTRGRR